MKINLTLLIVWSIFILFATIVPLPQDNESINSFNDTYKLDKILHFFLFGIFAYIIFENLVVFFSKYSFILSWMITFLYSGIIEITQKFIPGRSCSLNDFFTGALGAFVILSITYARKKQKK